VALQATWAVAHLGLRAIRESPLQEAAGCNGLLLVLAYGSPRFARDDGRIEMRLRAIRESPLQEAAGFIGLLFFHYELP